MMKVSSRKVTINFKVPEELFEEMMQAIIKNGYGMRGKSKWVAEAIIRLLKLDDYIVFVEKEAAVVTSLKKAQTITVFPNIDVMLSKAVLETRKKIPMLEGVKSRIIRAAIMQRLIRG